jgi:hypothetical protein
MRPGARPFPRSGKDALALDAPRLWRAAAGRGVAPQPRTDGHFPHAKKNAGSAMLRGARQVWNGEGFYEAQSK